MILRKPSFMAVVLAAIAVAAAVVVLSPTRVDADVSLEVSYSALLCGTGLPANWSPPTWEQIAPHERASSYDTHLPQAILQAGVIWRRTGEELARQGIAIPDMAAWRDRHFSIDRHELYKAESGDVFCRYYIQFSGVDRVLAEKVLLTLEHEYREHRFSSDHENAAATIRSLETRIAATEALLVPLHPSGSEVARLKSELGEHSRQLSVEREEMRRRHQRRTIRTGRLQG